MEQRFLTTLSWPDDGRPGLSAENVKTFLTTRGWCIGGQCIDVKVGEVTDFVMQPEPAIKDGDRVKIDNHHRTPVVEALSTETLARLRFDNGTVWENILASRLTVIPPEPEPSYHVEYKDDCLNLRLTADDSLQAYCEMSEPPAVVDELVELWARNFGIDADAVRKLIAVPTVIATVIPVPGIMCLAIRTADGWHARMGPHRHYPKTASYDYTNSISEDAGRGHFPGTEGPYDKP